MLVIGLVGIVECTAHAHVAVNYVLSVQGCIGLSLLPQKRPHSQ